MKNQYKEIILTALLNRYERSEKSRGRDTGRRIQLREKDAPSLFSYSTAEEKRGAISALEELQDEKIITFSYLPGEEGYIIDRIVLCEENIMKAYEKAGRTPLQQSVSELISEVKKAATSMPLGELRSFLESEAERMETRRVPDRRFFTGNDGNMLKALIYLSSCTDPLTKRTFSIRCFGDSKTFEKEAEPAVMRVLRAVHGSDATEEEVLASYGITRYPEIIEFRGRVKAIFRNGRETDFSALSHGAYINSESIAEISEIMTDASRVISFENKANYVDWISRHHDEDEIIIWHGGFYSPSKGKFMKMIASSVPQWRHSSDIDIGGFRIFRRLKDEIAPQAVPYMMDRSTLISNLEKTQKAKESYLSDLETMLSDEGFSVFHETIRTMLEYGVRLEQEALIP